MSHSKTHPNGGQSQKFKDAARATGCDEDEAAFDKRLKQIAKAAPPKPKAKAGRKA